MLTVSGVTKGYKNKMILDNISFTVESSSVIGIVGRNGAGKSTLLSIISSIMPPDSGDIKIDGKSIIKHPQLAKYLIGFVPQEDCLFSELSVYDNIAFWASAYKVKKDQLWRDGSITNILGINEFKRKKINELSGGMKKRVAIATSILHSPGYLILDEPCSGLDIFYKKEIIDYLKLLKGKGKTIIYTSHDLTEINSICDIVYAIKDCKLIPFEASELY